MKNMIGNYQQREYMENYVDRNEYGYYDTRNPMYHLHHQYGMGANYTTGTGPLYNYLQGQSQYHMMYPQQP